mmetsp:Transcript_7522/g.9091  ORF Transcript_7522/g.9091 Transcript_7522/m.9091 type:complete len:138 (+) Transcript_7522:77-490(+)
MWATLYIIFGNYEAFKLENSLIGAIYSTSPLSRNLTGQHGDKSIQPDSIVEAQQALRLSVTEKGRYFYDYREHLCVSFLKTFCCCLAREKDCFKRRLRRLERYEEASEKLKDELDITKLLYLQRIGELVAKLFLKKH